MKHSRILAIGALAAIAICLSACGYQATQSNDSQIAQQQEEQQAEGDRQVPSPRIVNWNERRMFNHVMEMRDRADLATWTYTKNMDGKYTFVCESVGYGIPYNTRANNPQHYEFVTTRTGVTGWNGNTNYYTDSAGRIVWGEHAIMAQAEPNGLFIPESAHGTWNICRNPANGQPAVTYQEEDVSVFPFRLPDGMVEGFHPAPLPPIAPGTAVPTVPSPY